MTAQGAQIEVWMWATYLLLLAMPIFLRPGWWLLRWLPAWPLVTAGFALRGHTPFPMFGVEPWHSWLGPLVEWADGLPALGIGTMTSRDEGALLLILVGLLFVGGACLAAERRGRQASGPACPFNHQRGGNS